MKKVIWTKILAAVMICFLFTSCDSDDDAKTVCLEAAIKPYEEVLNSLAKNQFIAIPEGGTWAVVSGGGTIDDTGLYTAPAAAADTTVKISYTLEQGFNGSDCDERVAYEEFTVKEKPACVEAAITPYEEDLNSLATNQFIASPDGGTWALVSGGGTISETGLYTAPSVAADTTVKVSYTLEEGFISPDCAESIAIEEFTVKSDCLEAAITPYDEVLASLATNQFVATPEGGTWAVVSGGGTISETGLYTALSASADTTVKISYTLEAGLNNPDCPESIAFEEFTVKEKPACLVAEITPYDEVLNSQETNQFTASPVGGTWAVVSGGGTISETGLYTAAAVTGETTIKISYTLEQNFNGSDCDESIAYEEFTVNIATYSISDKGTITAVGPTKIGDVINIAGVDYTVVDNTTIKAAVEANKAVITTFVTTTENLFKDNATFNGDISSWDMSNVTTMKAMFWGATSFNQNISAWNTSNVTNMNNMFREAVSFNQPIGDWDLGNCTATWGMFTDAKIFNQDISSWNTSQVTSLGSMFKNALAFNQDLSGWDVGNVAGSANFDLNTPAWTLGKPTFN